MGFFDSVVSYISPDAYADEPAYQGSGTEVSGKDDTASQRKSDVKGGSERKPDEPEKTEHIKDSGDSDDKGEDASSEDGEPAEDEPEEAEEEDEEEEEEEEEPEDPKPKIEAGESALSRCIGPQRELCQMSQAARRLRVGAAAQSTLPKFDAFYANFAIQSVRRLLPADTTLRNTRSALSESWLPQKTRLTRVTRRTASRNVSFSSLHSLCATSDRVTVKDLRLMIPPVTVFHMTHCVAQCAAPKLFKQLA